MLDIEVTICCYPVMDDSADDNSIGHEKLSNINLSKSKKLRNIKRRVSIKSQVKNTSTESENIITPHHSDGSDKDNHTDEDSDSHQGEVVHKRGWLGKGRGKKLSKRDSLPPISEEHNLIRGQSHSSVNNLPYRYSERPHKLLPGIPPRSDNEAQYSNFERFLIKCDLKINKYHNYHKL